MQRRPLFWILCSLLCLGGAFYFWHLGDQWQAEKIAARPPVTAAPVTNTNAVVIPKAQASQILSILVAATTNNANNSAATTNVSKVRFPYRLANTTNTVGQLLRNDKAILLANALIDTGKPINFAIPPQLRAPTNNGTYLLQARGSAGDSFRAMLRAANATIVSYIPNNAFLVRISDDAAQTLTANPLTQSVLPYEPYYKLDPSLLKSAIENPSQMPPNGLLVTVFADAHETTAEALRQMGATLVSEDRSPFGPVLKVQTTEGMTLAAVASLPGVQGVEPSHTRIQANDIIRTTLGVSIDTVTTANYLGLTGSNVLVNINDLGVDAGHPDFGDRISGDTQDILTDSSGHGTHVAGSILGSGLESSTVTNAQGSVSNANFRGLAPNASAFVMSYFSPDSYLQETAAQTKALISNNSWNFADSATYDVGAASYDAAVRDALPEVTGSQPLLFVFSAGNIGAGFDSGDPDFADNILSPATAKNVITVGAVEEPRFITNFVVLDGVTNSEIFNATDSGSQVASFSSRGNVGVNIEGDNGRFKPDVVSPGTFVISDRSTTWDTNAYYNSPTNFSFQFETNQIVQTNSRTHFLVSVPPDAIQLVITLLTNELSGGSLPPLPIYVADNTFPTVGDLVGTNEITLPTNQIPLVPGDTLYYDVGNSTTQAVNFGVQITIISTNDVGNFYSVLFDLNNDLGPYYRYESGTSMAAAGVSGLLACMQEFFESHKITASPALMKALVINGSRSLGDQYNFMTANSTTPNSQGWGLPNLSNSIPPELASLTADNANTMPLQFFDQSTNAVLSTGQSRTRILTLTSNATLQDLRMTLVWTDPPGNPIAGVKLVNDLDLIVTNIATGEVFYGNDFQASQPYTQASDTNGPPNIDSVNNVENVYLPAPLGTNYSVTVLARRVNVNAITANTNNIVQDYALVISSGDGGTVANAFQLSDANGGKVFQNAVSNYTVISNAAPLLNQRVGGNSQFAGSTNGNAAQWNFYVFTNTLAITNSAFTNVAFVTFQPPNLGLPRTGASGEIAPPDVNATRFAGADLDLYVSSNPALTNLDTNAVAAAQKAVTRIGTEVVYFTNSTPGQVYYVGVKSEDQEGAQFNLIGFATDTPFSQVDQNGNVVVNMNTVPLSLPGGLPTKPASAFLIGVCIQPIEVRKVVVRETVTAQDFGDYIGSLNEGGTVAAILNNHSFFTNQSDTQETLTYDDSGENEFPGALTSAGPGTLRNFDGISALGTAWTFTMINDSSPSDVGTIKNMTLTLERQPINNSGFTRIIPANSWYYGFTDVPAAATNLTISVSGNTAVIDLYVSDTGFPTFGSFDDFVALQPPGGSLSVSKFTSPPLNAGRYYYGVYNGTSTAQSVFIVVNVGISLTPVEGVNFMSVGNEPLLDDAVTYSTNHVSENSAVVSAEVGVRIDHPRESDLVLTLISPQGTRVLLAENRGGFDTNGYGFGVQFTNNVPITVSANDFNSYTNVIPTFNNFGTLNINYDFSVRPDDLQVYYDGGLIYDSGLIAFNGTITVDFGPGTSTNIVIVMNGPGLNPGEGDDFWTYTATVVTPARFSYATFSENTNLATIPIKFAVPPFGAGVALLPPQTILSSGFEGVTAKDYSGGLTVDGWTVLGDRPGVKVVTVPAFADSGSNVLALHTGGISRALPTVAGKNYTLTFKNHGRPAMVPVSWWKGEGNAEDSADGNNGTLINGIRYAAGEVGNAFSLSGGAHIRVGDANNLHFTKAMAAEAWINPTSIAAGGGMGVMVKYDEFLGASQSSFSFSVAGSGQGYMFVNATGTPAGPSPVAQTTSVFPLNTWTHFATTYDGNFINIYFNGILQDSVAYNGGIFPGTDDLGIGGTVGAAPVGTETAPFQGLIDEPSLYGRSLSIAEIQDIYAAGSAGKCPIAGANCEVSATVTLGTTTNVILGIDEWTMKKYTFTADSDNMVLQIIPDEDGMLLDSFTLVETPGPNPANYYLPEESLDKVIGEPSAGDWQLEVLDNRVGATNPTPVLLSWQLNLVLADKVPFAIPLSHAQPQTNMVPPNSIFYFLVDVPIWANFATNILTAQGGALNLLFNQEIEPTGSNSAPPDSILIPGTTNGLRVIDTTNSTPRLEPGRRYYLGVQNTTANPVTFTVEVDFDITTLTNGVPLTSTIASGNVPRYFQFDVDTNAVAAFFQLLSASGTNGSSGDVEMVIRKGPPLPDESSFDYFTDLGTYPQTITVLTNTTPVPVGPGRWYIGVFNNDTKQVTYTVMATEVGPPNIITLTNGIPFDFHSSPGPALTNFFRFNITNDNPAALFELYNLSGDVDLTLQRGAIPYVPPFTGLSASVGTNSEQIVIRTNMFGTNIIDSWYLGVPNNTSGTVTYTIRAVVSTNGLLISGLPLKVIVAFPPPNGSKGPTLEWPGVSGEYYEIQTSPDLINWTTIATVIGTGPDMSFTDPLPPIEGVVFYRIIQVPGP